MKNIFLAICLAFCSIFLSKIKAQPIFEVRAIWVASVENIDWPSKKGLNIEIQKSEFTKLLDMHQRNGMNTVFVQVRPAGDAFYPSSYEPE